MIISASRRTDIPAFYSRWFMNRVRAGFCEVVNPFNARQKSLVSLKPEDVDAIVFWTRYPAPLFPHLRELDDLGYNYYFQFTLTPYGRDLEIRTIRQDKLIKSFVELSRRVGPERIIWRYDPIIIGSYHTFEKHLEHFRSISESLTGFTIRVMISFADYYKKSLRNLRDVSEEFELNPESREGFPDFVSQLAEIARGCGMEIRSCAEARELEQMGIAKGACIDLDLIRRITGREINYSKDPHQRPECRCVVSKDIGAYNTCPFGCRYCYAVNDHKAALSIRSAIRPESPFLG